MQYIFFFPKKKKTLWGTLGNSSAATAPVSSPPRHPSPVGGLWAPHLRGSWDYRHHTEEGAQWPGVCPATGEAHTSSRRELRLQAPPGQGAATGNVPIHRGVRTPHFRGSWDDRHHLGQGAQQLGVCPATWECLHLISEGGETTGTRASANQGRLCMHIHRPEKAYRKKRVGRSWEHQDCSRKRKPTNKGITNR